ncbi:MAG: hypothetical protein JNM17_27215 [Archangium sp.]|nr:hypothetical protein [Archangium sp.]
MRGPLFFSVVFALALAACATTKDSVGGGDARLDDTQGADQAEKRAGRLCGADAPGDVVLIDARNAGPVTCLAVTITREPMSCPSGTECPSEVLFKGFTSPKGQLKLIGPVEKARLVAVADGFTPSILANATSVKDRVLELELAPEEGFWLKVLDGDGNYLQDLTVTFKQGEEVIAKLSTNTLANVFFTKRQPFSGQPVIVEAQGYASQTINSVSELGEDGHTLTLTK